MRGLLQDLRCSLSELDASDATTAAAQRMLAKQRYGTVGPDFHHVDCAELNVHAHT